MSKKAEKGEPAKGDTSPAANVEAVADAVSGDEQLEAEPDDAKASQAEPEPEPEPESETTRAPIVEAESPRARSTTIVVSAEDVAAAAAISAPPAMPTAPRPVDVSMGGIEDPTHMPTPTDIPGGHPNDPASAPGRVPAGDSRSLRRDNEFALVYRRETYVVTRSGTVGTRGQWRVVEYPTSPSASHSYAKECSRFVSDGYSDYRD